MHSMPKAYYDLRVVRSAIVSFFMENGLVVLSFHREGDCR